MQGSKRAALATTSVVALAMAFILGAPTEAAAQTWTGNGGDNKWNTSGNWLLFIKPSDDVVVSFDPTIFSGHSTSNNDISGLTLKKINFAHQSRSLTLEGEAIGLTGDSFGVGLRNNSVTNQFIELDLSVDDNQRWYGGGKITDVEYFILLPGGRAIDRLIHDINLTEISGDIEVNSDLEIGGNFVLLGDLSGDGALNLDFESTSDGLNTTFLAGNNSGFSGDVTVGDGTSLQLYGNDTLNNSSAVDVNGELGLNGSTISIGTLSGDRTGTIDLGSNSSLTTSSNNTDAEFAGVISGDGSFTKSGGAALTLSGLNTHTGGTTVNGGQLNISNDTLQGDLVTNGMVVFDVTDTDEVPGVDYGFSGTISGTGGITKRGNGTLGLQGDYNTFSGDSVVEDGTLLIRNSGVSANILNNATTIFAAVNPGGFYSGDMSGSGKLIKQGLEDLKLTGTNTYSGGTDVIEGRLVGGTAGLQGDIGVRQGASVVFSGVGLQAPGGVFNGTISGAGRVVMDGAFVDMRGTLLHTGGTTISGGTVRVRALDELFQGDVSITGGTLATATSITNTQSMVLNGNGFGFSPEAGTTFTQMSYLGGGGGLRIAGAGTFELGADERVGDSHALEIQGGTFDLNGFREEVATVNMESGSIIDTDGNGRLTASEFAFEDGLVSAVLDGGPLRKVGTKGGTVVLSRNNTYTGGTTIEVGTLSISSNANLGGEGDVAMYAATLQSTATMDIGRDFVLSGECLGGGQYCSPRDENEDEEPEAGSGGSGGGDGSGTGDGSEDDKRETRSFSTFEVAADTTLTLSGVISDRPLPPEEEPVDTCTGTGGGCDGDDDRPGDEEDDKDGGGSGGNNPDRDEGDGSGVDGSGDGNNNCGTKCQEEELVKLGALEKAGEGTLVLTGDNTYSRGTKVSGGTLQVSQDSNLGAAEGVLIFDGGTLQATETFAMNRVTSLEEGGGSFQVDGNKTLTQNGAISGEGDLSKDGAGDLVLTGENTMTGSIYVNAGRMKLDGAGSLASIASLHIAAGAEFGFNDNPLGPIVADFVSNGVVQGGTGGNVTEFSGNISGAGSFADNVLFSGSYGPGNSPALVTHGNTTFASTNTLFMELGGLVRGTEYDAINATSVTLGGLLDISLIDNFAPAAGDVFDLIIADQIFGAFSSFSFAALVSGLFFETNLIIDEFGDDIFQLVVQGEALSTGESVPGPGAVFILVIGLAGFGALRNRR